MGAINLKKKQSEGKTLLCCEYLLDKYPNPDPIILPIEKFTVSAQVTQEHRPRVFFQPTVQCICVNFYFFCDDGTHIRLQDIFFLKLPTATPNVKWLIP